MNRRNDNNEGIKGKNLTYILYLGYGMVLSVFIVVCWQLQMETILALFIREMILRSLVIYTIGIVVWATIVRISSLKITKARIGRYRLFEGICFLWMNVPLVIYVPLIFLLRKDLIGEASTYLRILAVIMVACAGIIMFCLDRNAILEGLLEDDSN